MKILVCGGRDFTDYACLSRVLDQYHDCSHIIHGAAKGADSLANEWALNNGVQPVSCPAAWNYHGKSAGYMRNAAMLELLTKEDLVVAFAGGKGTAMMCNLARDKGIDVDDYSKEQEQSA